MLKYIFNTVELFLNGFVLFPSFFSHFTVPKLRTPLYKTDTGDFKTVNEQLWTGVFSE